MAQFYTLEEAASRLGISPEEFKRRLKLEWTSIRPFRDGPTLRFRAADIDELARSLGVASDPGLPLGPVGSPPAITPDEAGTPDKARSGRKADLNAPLGLADDDELTLPTADSGILGRSPAKSGSDSDVRLDLSSVPPAADAESALPTEEISLDLGPPSSGVLKPPSSSKLSAPKSGKLSSGDSGKIPGPTSGAANQDEGSSEFELSLDSDSDSFELQLTSDSSEEVDLGALDFAPEKKSSQSGINLGKPADSGVSLEKQGPKTGPIKPSTPATTDADSDVDFELSLDPAGTSGVRLGGPKSGPKMPVGDDSSSEFELTLDDNSGVAESLASSLQAPAGEEAKGDIFETDFELPAMSEGAHGAVESADTDLEGESFDIPEGELNVPVDDLSRSEVMTTDEDAPPIIEDEDAPVVVEDEDVVVAEDVVLDDTASASGALRGVDRGERDERPAEVRTIVQTPPKWGPLPAVVLFPTLIVAFLGMLMSFEVVRGMWGYEQGGKPSGLIVRGLADTFGMKVND